VPPRAGALVANNWSRMKTDQGPCMSSSHVKPVRSGAVPARKILKRAGGTSRRDPPPHPDHANQFTGGDQTYPRHTRWTAEGPIGKRWTAEGPRSSLRRVAALTAVTPAEPERASAWGPFQCQKDDDLVA